MKKSLSKQALLIFTLILFIAILILWFYRFNKVNTLSYAPHTEIYDIGETIDIGSNYFFDAVENPDGYTIRVDSVHLIPYEEYITTIGGIYNEADFTDYGYPPPDYVYDLEVTIANGMNTDGYIFCGKYSLFSQSLSLPVDYGLWNILAPHINGSLVFTLKTDSEVTMHIPFTAHPADQITSADKVSSMLKNNEFYLCISEFPVRKLVKIQL